GMITMGTNLEDDRAAVTLCLGRENVRCAIGIHPNYCQDTELADIEKLRDLQADPSVVALGEMGLDYFHKFAERHRQKQFFETQLAVAAELNRPVVIHSREAIADTL